jgi:hypothetical protein
MTRYDKLLCLVALMATNTDATPLNQKRASTADTPTLNFPCTGHRFGDMTGELNVPSVVYRKR